MTRIAANPAARQIVSAIEDQKAGHPYSGKALGGRLPAKDGFVVDPGGDETVLATHKYITALIMRKQLTTWLTRDDMFLYLPAKHLQIICDNTMYLKIRMRYVEKLHDLQGICL